MRIFGAALLAAADVVFLHGQVEMPGSTQPGKSVEIKLSCGGAEPVRQTVTDKKGAYNLRVERDEFNHVLRALPATATDMGATVGPCSVLAVLKGYDSSRIDLGTFTIPQDLSLPKLVLKPSVH
jgi:hypothetical protein